LRTETAAQSIIDRVKQVVKQRRDYYVQANMPQKEVERVEAALSAWRV